MKKPIPFGKYYLLDRIHWGGVAEVFRAKAFGVEGFERIVAVKRILPSVAADTDFIKLFIDEAKVAVQLNHANIAQIFDLGKVGEAYFIALEYVHGKDLRAISEAARREGKPVPVELPCFAMMKACEGLDYAHNKRDPNGRELRLVHCDVSPQNILISFDGEIKLIDFGVARAAGRTGKVQAQGRLSYLSPEQVAGDMVDRRSDVFGVGIVLHELLTGQRLFANNEDSASAEIPREVLVPRPSARNPRIPAELDAIVMRALSPNPDDRYQTAMDLHDDLQRFLYGRGESFGRRELSAWMQEYFAVEAALDQEAVGDLQDVEVVATSENTDEAPTLEPAEPIAVNRDNSGNPKKNSTMLGMPAVFPQGGAGRSVPPPPPRGAGTPSVPPGHGRSVPPPPPRSTPPAAEPGRGRTVPPAPPRATVPPAVGKTPTGPVSVPKSIPPGQVPAAQDPYRRQPSVPPGQVPAVAVVSQSIPSVTAPASSPPPGRSLPPPPPGPGYVSSAPQSTGTALGYAPPAASPVLRMDWDDEELSTQIYDRPEEVQVDAGYGGAHGGATAEYVDHAGYADQSNVATYAPAAVAVPNYAQPAGGYNAAAPVSVEAPVTSRAAQVTQPIVTQSGGGQEKNRGLVFAGLAVAAVAVLCIALYVFLAKTEPGVVQLTTHPLDAQVLFDGKPVGGTSSPFVVTGVTPNENHVIEVKKDGYTSWSQQIQVTPGQTLQLPVGLELLSGGGVGAGAGAATTSAPAVANAQPGAFSLETVPAGAKVFLDGQELGGLTPLRVGNLAPRKYDVRVRLDGFREVTVPVEVRSGVDQSLPRVVLEALQLRVRITSEPPNADVELTRDGERRAVGKTPVDVTLDNNGTPWVVAVSKSGFESHRETLNAQAGSAELAVRAVLMKSSGGSSSSVARASQSSAPRATASRPAASSGGGTGTLRLNARPWAQVFINGKSIGNTPQMNIQLPAGEHKITLVNPEFRLRKTLTVQIKAGQVETQIVSLQ